MAKRLAWVGSKTIPGTARFTKSFLQHCYDIYVIDLQNPSANRQVSVGAKTAVRFLTDNSNCIRRFFINHPPQGGDASGA